MRLPEGAPGPPARIVARESPATPPIYYTDGPAVRVGASPLEVAREAGLRAVADPASVARFLLEGAVAGDGQTIFRGVRELLAGQSLEIAGDAPAMVRDLSDPPYPGRAPRGDIRSLNENAEALRSLLFETVAAIARTSCTGFALSGGIDSSGIGAALRAALGPDARLPAFCFVHDDASLPDSLQELPSARLAAGHLRAHLHEVRIAPSSIPDLAAREARAQGVPLGSPVLLAQAEVFRRAAVEGVDVMLSGHGPDYLFGGGDSHVRERAIGLLRAGRLATAWRFLRGASPYAATTPWRLLDGSLRQATGLRRPGVGRELGVRTEWFRERGVVLVQGPGAARGDMHGMIREQVLKSRLPSALAWETGNAAAAGIEVRLPYLTGAMMRLAASLPVEQLVTDAGRTRAVLRLALRGLVPDPILERPHPVGFAVPALSWLQANGAWVDRRLAALADMPFCDVPRLRAMRERLGPGDAGAWRTAYGLWRWIGLLGWFEAHGVAVE